MRYEERSSGEWFGRWIGTTVRRTHPSVIPELVHARRNSIVAHMVCGPVEPKIQKKVHQRRWEGTFVSDECATRQAGEQHDDAEHWVR